MSSTVVLLVPVGQASQMGEDQHTLPHICLAQALCKSNRKYQMLRLKRTNEMSDSKVPRMIGEAMSQIELLCSE